MLLKQVMEMSTGKALVKKSMDFINHRFVHGKIKDGQSISANQRHIQTAGRSFSSLFYIHSTNILLLLRFSFCTSIKQCSILDPEWDNPQGVPIEGIIFGGRRPAGVPLVYESFDWQHGVFVGASMRSEATAAAEFKGKTKVETN